MQNRNTELKVTGCIEKAKWREFVFDHPQGNIFQTPEIDGRSVY